MTIGIDARTGAGDARNVQGGVLSDDMDAQRKREESWKQAFIAGLLTTALLVAVAPLLLQLLRG